MNETRTVHFIVDPALAAYSEYAEAEGREFSLDDYDLFAAGYRWRDSMAAAQERAAAGGGQP